MQVLDNVICERFKGTKRRQTMLTTSVCDSFPRMLEIFCVTNKKRDQIKECHDSNLEQIFQLLLCCCSQTKDNKSLELSRMKPFISVCMCVCECECVCERGLCGCPSCSLLSYHNPAHADRFIRYNNQSQYHPALLCTGSSCNWLLHLEFTINMHSFAFGLKMWLSHCVICFEAPSLDGNWVVDIHFWVLILQGII